MLKSRRNLQITPLALGVASTLITFLVSILRGIENLGVKDASDYVGEALDMLKGWSYMQQNSNQFGHGFGFTFTIYLTFVLTNSTSLLLFKALLAVGHGIATYLLAKIGIKIGLKNKYWQFAAILFALDPFMILAATDAQTESLTTLIVIYWAYLFISNKEDFTNYKFITICFALSGAYSTIMRPNSLLPLIILAVVILVRWNKEGLNAFTIWLFVSIYLFIIALFEIFLTKLYSGFVFLTPVGGTNAEFMCRKEFIPQYLGYASNSENKKINLLVNSSQEGSILLANPEFTVSQLNRELIKIGAKKCLEDPFESAYIIILKIFALWRPFTVYGAYGKTVFLATLTLWLPLTLLTIWYVTNSKLNAINKRLRNYFVLMSFGFTLSLILTPTQIRHRVAFAEPFYWIFTIVFIQYLYQRYKSSRKSFQE